MLHKLACARSDPYRNDTCDAARPHRLRESISRMRTLWLMMLAGVARALVAPAAKRPRFTRAFAAAGDPREVLEKAVASALGAAFGPEYNDPSKAALRPATKKAFGDFQ